MTRRWSLGTRSRGTMTWHVLFAGIWARIRMWLSVTSCLVRDRGLQMWWHRLWGGEGEYNCGKHRFRKREGGRDGVRDGGREGRGREGEEGRREGGREGGREENGEGERRVEEEERRGEMEERSEGERVCRS